MATKPSPGKVISVLLPEPDYREFTAIAGKADTSRRALATLYVQQGIKRELGRSKTKGSVR